MSDQPLEFGHTPCGTRHPLVELGLRHAMTLG